MRVCLSKILLSTLYKSLSHSSESTISTTHLSLPTLLKTHISTIPNRPMRGEERDDLSEDLFLRKFKIGDESDAENTTNAPIQIPNRPVRGEKRDDHSLRKSEQVDESDKMAHKTNENPPFPIPNRPMRGGKRNDQFEPLFNNDKNTKTTRQKPPTQFPNRSIRGEKEKDDHSEHLFLQKFKLRDDDGTKDKYMEKTQHIPNKPMSEEKIDDQFEHLPLQNDGTTTVTPQNPPTQIAEKDTSSINSSVDADEIFRKMKETGLIPNAVAMLDGLCKDGLIHEAMKLFGLMREKGTIPEVVIYTAVVEGFCKASKLDDAKRIFRKMQQNGILPNAFSYTVLIQGLCKGKKLEDSVDFCVEMLEAGHSPNVATFVGLVDVYCREKRREEVESVIGRLREKGFAIDDKAVREHLDKKGPFSPSVWELIFGKKSSQRLPNFL